MLTDLYQLTMMNGYYTTGRSDKRVVFDLFYRGKGNSYAIACGLEQAVEYIMNLHFTAEDINYLRRVGLFSEQFLQYLQTLRFTGDVYAVPEGTVIFPNEPIMTVVGGLAECQLIESALLCIIGHQTLIATKASHIVREAEGKKVCEMGLRRAQGVSGALYGSRAAYIGGVDSTSNVQAGEMFDIPVQGTMAHSWIMGFDSEYEAFEKYAEIYPKHCVLLVDTYNTLASGIPNAIKVFEKLRSEGHEPFAIRLDSGDIAYLSKQARQMLDNAGFPEVKIIASGDIDEDAIRRLNSQGAKIDLYGIGSKLITSENCPSLGAVYKLAAIEQNGELVPKLKKSDTVAKVTNPGFKKIVRFIDKDSSMAVADLIALHGENFEHVGEVEIFDQSDVWKRMTLKEFYTAELMVQIIDNGKVIYDFPSCGEIRDYAYYSQSSIPSECLRDETTYPYKVDLTKDLYDLKMRLITEEK